ncbi:MAG: hypothetical protein O210_OD1C00001G0228 [Parcubacteria bacterium RAAC4_OD1_1]|nr:MAG: hypothetical protein O210_OD1C00001G0228 [Parcubacteria bacterium RAAC4_OD1_1]
MIPDFQFLQQINFLHSDEEVDEFIYHLIEVGDSTKITILDEGMEKNLKTKTNYN